MWEQGELSWSYELITNLCTVHILSLQHWGKGSEPEAQKMLPLSCRQYIWTSESLYEHESLQIFQKTLAGCKHSADDRMLYDYVFLSTLRQSAKEYEDETSGLWNVHQEQKGEEQAFHNPLKRKGSILAKLLKLHVCLCSHLQLQINNYSKQKISLIEFQTAKAHLFSYQYHCHLPGNLLYKSRKKGRFLPPSQKKKNPNKQITCIQRKAEGVFKFLENSKEQLVM